MRCSRAVDLVAEYDGRAYRRRVTVTATGDEGDVYVSAIGPGAVEEKGSGLFARTRYSGFEFGALIMGATTEEGTRVGKRIGIVEHGPGDGIGERWAVAGS
jgi:hypothetical protein